jgi:hypothetical protein
MLRVEISFTVRSAYMHGDLFAFGYTSGHMLCLKDLCRTRGHDILSLSTRSCCRLISIGTFQISLGLLESTIFCKSGSDTIYMLYVQDSADSELL